MDFRSLDSFWWVFFPKVSLGMFDLPLKIVQIHEFLRTMNLTHNERVATCKRVFLKIG